MQRRSGTHWFGGKFIDDFHLRVVNGVGEIIAFHRTNVSLTIVVIEFFHLILAGIVKIDSLFMQRGKSNWKRYFSNHFGFPSSVDDHEIVAGYGTQANGIRRVGIAGPMILTTSFVQHTELLKKMAHIASGMRAKLFIVADGQFKCRAFHVTEQDLQIIGIDKSTFRAATKKIFRMLNNVLVQGRAGGHQHRQRSVLTTASTPGPLPGGSDGARVTGHHHGIERPDIDAQFQRVGGNNGADFPVTQIPFNFTTLFG